LCREFPISRDERKTMPQLCCRGKSPATSVDNVPSAFEMGLILATELM
jgi:hypothetical protein